MTPEEKKRRAKFAINFILKRLDEMQKQMELEQQMEQERKGRRDPPLPSKGTVTILDSGGFKENPMSHPYQAEHAEPYRPLRPRPKGITHLEYIEMTSEEMKKFKNTQPVSKEEIDNVNWDELSQQLAS